MVEKFTPLRKFFSDKDGKLAILQAPNTLLIVWLLFLALSHILHPGHWLTLAQVVSKAAIIIWAILEVYSGASPFRRVLGIVVLAVSTASLL
jgi:hypothetical protein